MATKRIAASGGDYTTLSAWYASLPGTLTEPEIAELESFDLVEQLTFSSKNTTAANYIEIRAATGHGHNGVVGAGARVRCGSSPTLPTIYMTATHFRFTGIEIVMDKSGGTQEAFVLINASPESDVQVTGCIIRSVCTDTGVPAVNLGAGVSKFRNNIVISSCRSIDTRAATSCELSNNVFWRTANAIGCLADNNTTTRNCYSGASTGSSQCFYTATGGVGSYNASSDTTAGTLYATGSVNSVAGTAAFTAPGSNNFTLLAGSPLIDAGTTLAAVTTDIAGTSRPQNSVYDIGAFEKVAASGASGTAAVTEAGDTVAVTGHVSGAISLSEAGDVAALTGSTPSVGTVAVTESGDAVAVSGGIGSDGTVTVGSALYPIRNASNTVLDESSIRVSVVRADTLEQVYHGPGHAITAGVLTVSDAAIVAGTAYHVSVKTAAGWIGMSDQVTAT